MGADLNFGAAPASRPVRKQLAGDATVRRLQPVGCDDDVCRRAIEDFLQATSDIFREGFRDFAVGFRAGGSRQLARRV